MKNFRVRRIHIVCLAIATAEILIAAFVLWKNAVWNETQIQTANKQSVLSETQEETTSDIQENEKTATQNQEETKPVEEAVSSMPSMRVKLKNSDNTSFEHAKVIITCPDTFHIQSGTKEQIFTGGQTVTITPEHPFFQEGSIRVASEGGFVIIDSILRRGISHEYEGVLDLYLSEQGIVIVNELPLEDYVSKVVPSEMPVSYGLEAAKLQAVCARTYAYERILHQKTIDNYGSFADDSVDYQVYNSAGYQEISAQGAKLTSGVIMTRLVVPGMVERGRGHIINIGSIAGDAAYPGGSVYCATKAAVKALSDGLRIDLVDTPLRVTNVKPGMVETNFTVVRYRGDKEAADNFYKGIRPLTGDDIAETVYFAASAPAHIQIAEVLLMPTYQATGTISYKKKPE